MELHNIIEDMVITRVTNVFDTIENGANPDKLCTCSQCRMDTACYVLNRTTPFYVVSSRGAARAQQVTLERQQKEADITTLIYEGLRRVNHNQRPNFIHDSSNIGYIPTNKPVFNIPTITGRLFNGNNFEPVSGVTLELLYNGTLAAMKDANWQNPLHLVSHTEGTFSFWPVPMLAQNADEHAIFEFTLKVKSEEHETLVHVFKVAVTSEIQTSNSFTLERTFKLPDLYLFPPGEEEKNRYLSD